MTTGPDLREPPEPVVPVAFADGFGQRMLLTIDTEEEFDWTAPFRRDGFGLTHLARLGRFQAFCEDAGVIPVYLVDWPVATSPLAQDLLGPAIAAGRAEVGVQLHPWVNPPFDEEVSVRNSFAGNLPPPLERAKLLALRDAIEDGFGTAPLIYRAGRYGLGPATAAVLGEAGIAIDSSVRSRFSYAPGGGPDYRHHPLVPYWTDPDRTLIEAPLTTVHTGRLRHHWASVTRVSDHAPALTAALARTGMLERIALTPEGVPLADALRGVTAAVAAALPLIVLSFHSPSLAPGHTPYVRSEREVEALYAWLTAVITALRDGGVTPTSVREILAAVIA